MSPGKQLIYPALPATLLLKSKSQSELELARWRSIATNQQAAGSQTHLHLIALGSIVGIAAQIHRIKDVEHIRPQAQASTGKAILRRYIEGVAPRQAITIATFTGLAVTIAHYYTPNGTDISQKGIQPDIVLPLTREQLEKLYSNPRLLGTLDDPQYVRAVSTITKLISQRNIGQKPTSTFNQ